MATGVDIDEIEATTSEKFLAVVLAAFLLIGSIWIYIKVDAWVPGGPDHGQSVEETQAMRAYEKAYEQEQVADAKLARERDELALAKNAFDIAVAKGGPTAQAEADYAKAEDELHTAQRRAAETQRQTQAANRAVDQFAQARQDLDHGRHDWTVAGIRLGFIVAWLLLSLRIVGNLRRRPSRLLPLGFAAVGAGVITALVYATDYITDYIDPLDLGPIVLSVVGAVATVTAFVGLQRWLTRRIPSRRVRNGDCPFCGHPVRGSAESLGALHCEGCGREVIAPCASCSQPRRVGSPHCGACGNV